MRHLVIIGGSDAGISAALRAREIERNVVVTVIVTDAFPNYSICGLPFYLSGETPDWRTLAIVTRKSLPQQGLPGCSIIPPRSSTRQRIPSPSKLSTGGHTPLPTIASLTRTGGRRTRAGGDAPL